MTNAVGVVPLHLITVTTASERTRLNTMIADARKRLLEAPGRSPESVLRQLIDACPLAALVADNAGHYVLTNTLASKLTGYSPAELRKRSVWQLTPHVADHEAEILWRAFLEQRHQTGEYRLLVKGGRIILTKYAAQANVLPGFHVSLLNRGVSTGYVSAGEP
jgi:PAS domain S-box-containing protein